MKQCADVYRHICESLDEGLRSRKCRAIKRHIDGCPDCQTYLLSLKKTIKLCTSLPEPRVPKAAHRKLWEAIRAEVPVGTPRTQRPSVRSGRRRMPT